jgi:hypothetical protein
MDIDAPSQETVSTNSQPQLSTQVLQSAAGNREAERQERQKNGNISPREHQRTGKKLDQLCLSLAIQREETNSKGVLAPYYYCIACDEGRGNNSRSRALAHAKDCKVYH